MTLKHWFKFGQNNAVYYRSPPSRVSFVGLMHRTLGTLFLWHSSGRVATLPLIIFTILRTLTCVQIQVPIVFSCFCAEVTLKSNSADNVLYSCKGLLCSRCVAAKQVFPQSTHWNIIKDYLVKNARCHFVIKWKVKLVGYISGVVLKWIEIGRWAPRACLVLT